MITIDGARISFEQHQWALVRASNTQPKLTARFQATDSKSLIDAVNLVKGELENIDYVDISELDVGLKEVLG